MTITGQRADVDRFIEMLRNDMGATTAGRNRLTTVLNDTAHPTTYLVGRNQPGVLVDAFGTNQVDLADLEMFPSTAPAGHPNMATRGEILAHFVAERNHQANHGGGFGPAHADGITAQNEVRNELGQSPATSNSPAGTDAAGNNVANLNYANGTATVMHYDNTGKLTQLDPP